MPTADIKSLRTDLARSSSDFAKLHDYAKLDWEPWTQDGPTDALFPSDESMCAAAEASRTAYLIMHLTKDQLIKIHNEEAFDGFQETMANLASTAKMLKAVVQMIEGAHGRLLASACACLQDEGPYGLAIGIDGRLKPDMMLK
jgi:hypothetical protein